MSFEINKILLAVYAVSLILGAIDHFRGNRWQLGEQMIAGIRAFEPLFLTMAGVLVLIPLFSTLLNRALPPVCNFLMVDPSIFTGLLLANDMGAYPLAQSLTHNTQAADFSGMLLGSVFGVNLVFTLPTALKMIEAEDRNFFFKGMLIGLCTVPLGCFFGGLAAGYTLLFLVKMLIPVLVFSLWAAIALLLFPELLSRWLAKLGRVIEAVALSGIVAAIVIELLGFSKVKWIDSIQNGISVVGSIIIVLPGAYVAIALVQKGAKKILHKTGQLMGVNSHSVLGMMTSLANSIPTLMMIKDMDPKGKILNAAFLTAGAFTFGDHLAYCYAVAPQLIVPLLVTKLSAAFLALVLILLIFKWRKTQCS